MVCPSTNFVRCVPGQTDRHAFSCMPSSPPPPRSTLFSRLRVRGLPYSWRGKPRGHWHASIMQCSVELLHGSGVGWKILLPFAHAPSSVNELLSLSSFSHALFLFSLPLVHSSQDSLRTVNHRFLTHLNYIRVSSKVIFHTY